MGKEVVTDTEWEQYLKEKHSNYVYGKPKKEDIVKFLQWRRNARKSKSTKTKET